MLKRLFIKNVALIERLDMDFGNGFNVLTGETGAGKSIIIDAVNLALGERASKELIKTGADKASVEAEFDISGIDAALDILKQNELDCDDTITVSREISTSGKSVCRVNGTLVNLAVLKQITDILVDVHGQHEHQSLLMQSRHLQFLDSFAHDSVDRLKAQTAQMYSEYKAVRAELLGGFSSQDEREREIDILQYQINEIDKAKLNLAEENALMEERKMLMNAERIMSALQAGTEAISGDNGAVRLLGEASGAIKGIAELSGEYDAASKRLEETYYAVEDIGYSLRDLRNAFEFDPNRIDEIEQRLEIYSVLKKKYGPEVSDVCAFEANAKQKLGELKNAQERREELERKLSSVSAEYTAAAEALSSARKDAAQRLEKELLSQLADLGMGRARFEARFETLAAFSANGVDKVEFLLSANPGEGLKPLEKVASGGEMSRIMLAFKAIAARADMIPTLIFDEIDTGISGHIAGVVGSKMVNISDTHQVLCVTHLPQIAALADVHYMVEKSDDGAVTKTELKKLSTQERCECIARMMSGMDGSKLAYEHAKELIERSEAEKMLRRKAQ